MRENYKRIEIHNCQDNDTIYSYLRKNGYSENYTKKLRKVFGYIVLNDKEVFITHQVKSGDILEVNSNPQTKTCIQSCIIPLDIVYEDKDLLIINKPSNLACMPTKSHYDYNLAGAITNYMQEKDPNFVCRIVNRLDKDTAGLVMVAKNTLACNFLSNHNNTFKTYYALCNGIIKTPTIVDKNIFTVKDKNNIILQKREVSDTFGKKAITHIFPIKVFKNFSLIKLTLKYGRTHQIRAHLASINHSLLGDVIYGNPSLLIDHTALICKSITFIHPETKLLTTVEIDFPEEFKKLIRN